MNEPEQKQEQPAVAPAVTAPESAEAPQQAAEELIDYDYFSKVKLRVARIESAERLPKSKKLVKLQIDAGALGKRQILAGIAQHYEPEVLVGRKIIIVANLKPAKLMGEESQGMLLAAATEDGAVLSLLQLDKEIEAGATVR